MKQSSTNLMRLTDSFQEISKLGGIIADPKRPEEFIAMQGCTKIEVTI